MDSINKIICFFFVAVSNIQCCDLKPQISKIEFYLQQEMKAWDIPGLAVGIVHNGEIIFKKTFGVKEKGKNDPIDEHTAFCIASVSKNISAYLLQKLVQEKKIKWEDKVIQYLPDFFLISPEITQQLTIEDLVSHRCGLHPFAGDSLSQLDFNQDEIMKTLAKFPQERIFRRNYTYQNQIFGITGLILEKATGKTVQELIQEHLFSPLKMEDSWVGFKEIPWWKRWLISLGLVDKPNIASGHSFRDRDIVPIPTLPQHYKFPFSTGVNSSLNDMLIWVQFLLDKAKALNISQEKILEPHTPPKTFKSNDRIFPPKRIHDVSYCIGSFKSQFGHGKHEVTVFNQMGAYSGWRNLLAIIPEKNFGIIVLSNTGGYDVSYFPESFQMWVLDLLLGLPEHNWSQDFLNQHNESHKMRDEYNQSIQISHASPPLPLEEYQGKFHNDLYGDVEFTVENNKLHMIYRNKTVALTHQTGSTFEFIPNDLSPMCSHYGTDTVEFNPPDLNRCMISLMHEGKDTEFKKIQ